MKKGGIMNNQIPYFMNNQELFNKQNPNYNNSTNFDIEKIINKINRLEKNLRILENRVINLEMNKNNNYFNDDPTDMYMV